MQVGKNGTGSSSIDVSIVYINDERMNDLDNEITPDIDWKPLDLICIFI